MKGGDNLIKTKVDFDTERTMNYINEKTNSFLNNNTYEIKCPKCNSAIQIPIGISNCPFCNQKIKFGLDISFND